MKTVHFVYVLPTGSNLIGKVFRRFLLGFLHFPNFLFEPGTRACQQVQRPGNFSLHPEDVLSPSLPGFAQVFSD